ncbi:glycosyltransferase family 4 protein [Halobacillus shinanisalinarum]|uniref:Glycosyltransferase family 4 protein n=1 Tax=Halobacillus shinanisalinarum TaxID=2932258 RepID=A0ABY4H5N7_9BACI|nr:glycosyltransferase [Halobacillus shinanisalinarum]UOQ95444.1 glycosyltransferase family 4 protein [Halobacillus shinanisalinarum]
MRVLLASPNFHQPRGNTVTVQRIANSLEKLAVDTEIISTTDKEWTTLPEADIVHGFHAYHFYKFIQKLDKMPNPYMVTITGTDLNHDLFDEHKREDVFASLKGAKAIHVFDDKAREVISNELSEVEDKIFTIAQGNSDFPIEKSPLEKGENTFLFVLPAGIRKVKNVPEAVEMMSKLHDKFPSVRLWLVGPIIEEQEGKAVEELVRQHDWIEYLGQVTHSSMGAIYQSADAVLNTSHTEGQSSAIIEAMGYGLPVLVSNNSGNRNIVTHHRTGFVYKTPNEFLDYGEQIINNNEIKQKIGQQAKQYIADHHSSSYEADHFLKIYESILS